MDKTIYFILLLTIIISMSCESRSHKEIGSPYGNVFGEYKSETL